MRTLCWVLSAGAALAVAGVAHAADISVKAPVIKGAEPAQSPISGYLGGYGGYAWSNSQYFDGRDRVWLYGFDARVNFALGRYLSAQFDLEGEGSSAYKKCCSSGVNKRWQGVAGTHLALRNPEFGALGAFGGASSVRNLLDFSSSGNHISHWFVGGEAQLYLGNLTLYGQIGRSDWITGQADAGALERIRFARGVVRYFLTPNDMISAEYGYTTGPNKTDGDRVVFHNIGFKYEHAVPGSLWSGYIEYAYMRAYNKPDIYWAREHVVMVGLKTYFGQQTLQSNDRTGATFDLPKFPRFFAWSYNLY